MYFYISKFYKSDKAFFHFKIGNPKMRIRLLNLKSEIRKQF